MKRDERIAIGLWMLILGFGFRMSSFFGFALPAYPHEWFHGMVAVITGGELIEISAHHASWVGANDTLALAAGYFGEAIMYSAIAVIAARRAIGKFAAGIFLWLPIEAMYRTGDSDFEKIGQAAEGALMLLWVALLCVVLVSIAKRGFTPSRSQSRRESLSSSSIQTNQ